jgi:hypothetical protein
MPAKTTQPKKSDEEVELTNQCINYMAEIYTLAMDIANIPEWEKLFTKRNVKVIKRVLKISRSKTK